MRGCHRDRCATPACRRRRFAAAAFGAAAGETHLEIACNRCERLVKLSLARLVAQYGLHIPWQELLRDLWADCPKRMSTMVTDGCVYFSNN
jgi:hypothetical protein